MRFFIILYGLGGVLLLLGMPIYRLFPLVVESLTTELTLPQLVFALVWLVFMAYSEGYRGFQQRFAPRVVARAWYLADNPKPLHVLLAPYFSVGYFFGTRRRLLTSWGVSFAIFFVVMGVKLLEQPWRGLIDLGVLVGMSWGVISVLLLTARAIRDGGTSADPQIPESAVAAASS